MVCVCISTASITKCWCCTQHQRSFTGNGSSKAGRQLNSDTCLLTAYSWPSAFGSSVPVLFMRSAVKVIRSSRPVESEEWISTMVRPEYQPTQEVPPPACVRRLAVEARCLDQRVPELHAIELFLVGLCEKLCLRSRMQYAWGICNYSNAAQHPGSMLRRWIFRAFLVRVCVVYTYRIVCDLYSCNIPTESWNNKVIIWFIVYLPK